MADVFKRKRALARFMTDVLKGKRALARCMSKTLKCDVFKRADAVVEQCDNQQGLEAESLQTA